MLKTILKRILQSIPTLLIVITITFVLTRMIPGNPARTILGPQASAQDIAEMEIKLGLNKSKLEQYADYMIGILHGDFGTSYVYNRPVTSLIAERIPNTLVITSDQFGHCYFYWCWHRCFIRDKTVFDFRLYFYDSCTGWCVHADFLAGPDACQPVFSTAWMAACPGHGLYEQRYRRCDLPYGTAMFLSGNNPYRNIRQNNPLQYAGGYT